MEDDACLASTRSSVGQLIDEPSLTNVKFNPRGCAVVQWLACWTTRAEIWIEISAPPVTPSQLSYDGDGRTGHLLSYAEAKKMNANFIPMAALGLA